jgi:hypothetical protein
LLWKLIRVRDVRFRMFMCMDDENGYCFSFISFYIMYSGVVLVRRIDGLYNS